MVLIIFRVFTFSGSVQGVKIISLRITRLYEYEGQGLKLEVHKEKAWRGKVQH